MKKLNKNDTINFLKSIVLILLWTVIPFIAALCYYAINTEACELPLPPLPTNVKAYTDYHCYNIDGSAQKYIQDNAITEEHGIRMFDGYYCVAMGSAYGEVGDKYIIELSNGMRFAMIKADEKSDKHTDPTNRYHPCPNYNGEDRACVIEFIVDTDKIPEKVAIHGSFDYCELFSGDVKRISYMGRHKDPDISWE